MTIDVDSVFAGAQALANGAVADTIQALNAVQAQLAGFEQPEIAPIAVPVDNLPDPPALVKMDPLERVVYDAPPRPAAAPVFQDVGAVSLGQAPVLQATRPNLVQPATPTQIAPFLGTAPAISTQFDFPEPPTQLLNPTIPEPVIADRPEPVKPQVMLPEFSAVRPVNTAQAPADLAADFERGFQGAQTALVSSISGYVDQMLDRYNPQYSSQMARIEAQLTRYMEGGTGLSPDVENAIYERGRDKIQAEHARARDAAWSDAASRGFTLPDGVLHATVARSRQAAADNLARAATEIAIKQAEMEQQNLQFAVTTSTGLRTAVMSAALNHWQTLASISGQAIEYGKTVASLLVETYNARVRAFQVELDAYRAEAAVYDTRLKAALAAIDLYKAEVDVLQSMVQVDTAKINAYRARIESLGTLASVYRSRIDAITSKAGLEKLKLELFQSQVQTYTAQVQAKEAEWRGYAAAMSGEETKLRAFGEEVRAYSAQVDGYRAETAAKAEAVRAQAAVNEARARQFEAQMRAYSADVNARTEEARVNVAIEGQKLQAFQAEAQAAIANSTLVLNHFKTKAEVANANADRDFRAQLAVVEYIKQFQELLVRMTQAAAQTQQQFATAGLNSINAIVTKTADY